jgi:hypothetical protein
MSTMAKITLLFDGAVENNLSGFPAAVLLAQRGMALFPGGCRSGPPPPPGSHSGNQIGNRVPL